MGLEATSVEVSDVRIDLRAGGAGRTFLYLHGGLGPGGDEVFLDALSGEARVLAPTHPGFGASEWPHEFRGVDDLAYFYLDFAEAHGLDDAVLVGACFGGWLAAEMLIRSRRQFSRAVLIGTLGAKFSDRLSRDIADIHGAEKAEFDRLLFHDPAFAARDLTALDEATLTAIARDREAFAYYGWKPYMHNPGLRRWLHRIDVATLLLWGESDGFVTPDYGRAWAAAIPGARLETIAEAGHFPHLERPEETAARVLAFAAEGR